MCHPVGPALGNSLMETGKGRPCPTPLRRLIRAPEPPGSVSAKNPREVFVADVSPSCFFNSLPVARNPLVGRPVKSILPHIVKGQQSGTRLKKGKSSLHTLAMSAVESRAKYLGVLGTRFAPPPTVRLNCSRAPYQEQRIMPHNAPQCNDRCCQWRCQLWRSHKKFTHVHNAKSQFQQISRGFSLGSVAFLCCI